MELNTKNRKRLGLDFRVKLLGALISCLFLLVAIRATYLTTLSSSANLLKKIAHRQYNAAFKIAPNRGSIYDRNRSALAISIEAPSIAINPRVFKPTKRQIKKIAKILQIPPQKITKASKKTNYFAWLKRKTTREAQ